MSSIKEMGAIQTKIIAAAYEKVRQTENQKKSHVHTAHVNFL